MACTVDGCQKPVMYTERQICQMHYFRWMRHGHYGRKKACRGRSENGAGYQMIWQPDHPLASPATGYVFEHRAVVYADIGPAAMSCALCEVWLTWKTVRIDHIDCDVRNNARANLRPTCNTCNTRRGIGPAVNWSRTHKIEFGGIRQTAQEWARDPRVEVTGATIVRRLASGMDAEHALFAPKLTHNGKVDESLGRGHKRHAVQIDGVTKNLRDWSRTPGCSVTSNAIALRLRKGWPPTRAVFAPQANAGLARRAPR